MNQQNVLLNNSSFSQRGNFYLNARENIVYDTTTETETETEGVATNGKKIICKPTPFRSYSCEIYPTRQQIEMQKAKNIISLQQQQEGESDPEYYFPDGDDDKNDCCSNSSEKISNSMKMISGKQKKRMTQHEIDIRLMKFIQMRYESPFPRQAIYVNGPSPI